MSELPVSTTTATMRAIMAIMMTIPQRAITLVLMDEESNCSYNYIDGASDRHGYMWYAIT
jgi:hypothetical protein